MRFRALRDGGEEDLAGYAIERERGVFGRDGAFAIERFAVPEGDRGFVSAWEAEQDVLAEHPGWLGARLLHNGDWVGVTRWSSPLMHQRARAAGSLYQRG